MARPLRIDVEDGWHHITARGIERRPIFTEAREYEHFLDLLGEMSERYGMEVHGYVLMGNHYHLLVCAPHANTSQAIQWLNVSYSVWFNRRHGRVGHVFQGRFKSVLIDGNWSWLLLASAYLHLNPVRVRSLGLGKRGDRAESRGYVGVNKEEIKRRLEVLKSHRWSSYGAYVGYGDGPEWLVTDEILRRGEGRQKYRRFVESYVRRGERESEFEALKAKVVIGTRDYVEKAKRLIKSVSREQPDRKVIARTVAFYQIVRVVEDECGKKWDDFVDSYGDWGRELVLYLARKRSGLTLRAIGENAGDLDYKAVSKAVTRFADRLKKDRKLHAVTSRCLSKLSIVET